LSCLILGVSFFSTNTRHLDDNARSTIGPIVSWIVGRMAVGSMGVSSRIMNSRVVSSVVVSVNVGDRRVVEIMR